MTVNKPLAAVLATATIAGFAGIAATTETQKISTTWGTNQAPVAATTYQDVSGADTFFAVIEGERTEIVINDASKVAAQNEVVIAKMIAAGLPADHVRLVRAVADAGVLLFFNLEKGQVEYLDTAYCGADMMEEFGVEGELGGWYNSAYNEMSLCDDGGGFDAFDLHTIRHEVVHMLQDAKTGLHGNIDMVTLENTNTAAFQAKFAKVSAEGQDYANSYCEIGEYETCAQEAEAEALATTLTADQLANRVRQFTF